jgi:hypothetical protein
MAMNTLLQEIYNDVLEITKRPDLGARTSLAIQKATLKAHLSDFYYRDKFETSIGFPTSDYNYQLDPLTVVPRYRAIDYIIRLNPTTGLTFRDPLTPVDPKSPLDAYGYTKTNKYYAAGSVINIIVDDQCQYFNLGAYQFPNLTESGYDSWIATNFKDVIEEEAIRVIFKSMGRDDQAKAQESLVAEAYALLKISNIEYEGS